MTTLTTVPSTEIYTYYPTISGDGKKIAYETYVSATGHFKISVYDASDRNIPKTTVPLDFSTPAYGLDEPEHYFVFTRDGENLIYDEAPNTSTPATPVNYDNLRPSGSQNIYEWNLASGSFTVVSSSAPDQSHSSIPGNGVSTGGYASADGQWVIFNSTADNLVPLPDDKKGSVQVYLKNTVDGSIRLVSSTVDVNNNVVIADTSAEPNSKLSLTRPCGRI